MLPQRVGRIGGLARRAAEPLPAREPALGDGFARKHDRVAGARREPTAQVLEEIDEALVGVDRRRRRAERRRETDGDRIDLRVEQGYEIGRRSLLHLQAQRRGDEAEIRVGGHVVPTFRGALC